jgi:hypothetical protein
LSESDQKVIEATRYYLPIGLRLGYQLTKLNDIPLTFGIEAGCQPSFLSKKNSAIFGLYYVEVKIGFTLF